MLTRLPCYWEKIFSGEERKKKRVMVNLAPVPTLWRAVAAKVLGFEHDEALTLGRAVAGLNACSNGISLGSYRQALKR